MNSLKGIKNANIQNKISKSVFEQNLIQQKPLELNKDKLLESSQIFKIKVRYWSARDY